MIPKGNEAAAAASFPLGLYGLVQAGIQTECRTGDPRSAAPDFINIFCTTLFSRDSQLRSDSPSEVLVTVKRV